MTELKATGLVSIEIGEGQTPSSIKLDERYDWFTTDEFTLLKQGKFEDLCKEKCPPQKGATSIATPVFLYDSIINRKITNALPHNTPLSGGKISLHKSDSAEEEEKVSQGQGNKKERHYLEKPLLQQRKVSLSDLVDEYFRDSGLYPQATIHDNYVTVGGGYALLLRNATDALFSRYHPGILDGSLKIEFVTSKTETNPTVRFLKRQTPEYRYYYSCYHCYDISKATFGTIDEYNRHIVMNHKPGTVGYPGPPDIERIEVDRARKKQGN